MLSGGSFPTQLHVLGDAQKYSHYDQLGAFLVSITRAAV